MNRRILIGLFLLVPVLFLVVRTNGQEKSGESNDRWEYLIVSGASSTNFSPTASSSMRKEGTGAFAREAFVLEQQADKLGAKGWELVSVSGRENDPVYYFKRRK
jgi:hypothetical protein